MRPRIILAHTALILFLHATPRGALAAEPVSVVLAESGITKHDIVIAATADADVAETADTLADYLNRISGATFTVTTGDGTTGMWFQRTGTVNYGGAKVARMILRWPPSRPSWRARLSNCFCRARSSRRIRA